MTEPRAPRRRRKPQIRNRVREVRRMRAGDLLPNAKNWREHPSYQRDAMRGVLGEIGFAATLTAYENADGQLVLIDGHLRAEEAPDLQVDVAILDVTQEEADKILLTMDPLAAMASPNQDALLSLLDQARFQDDAVNVMLEALANGETVPLDHPPTTDDDDEANAARALAEAEAAGYVPTSKPGQIWKLGDHRVMCGDSADPAVVVALMDGETATIMATDPPYGVNYAKLVGSRRNQKKDGWADMENDGVDDAAMAVMLRASLAGAGATVAFVWHPAGPRRFLFWDALRENGWHIAQEIIWVKNALVFGRADYQWRHEPCLYAKRGDAPRQDDRTQTTVWEIAKATGTEHPTQKPVRLFEIPLENHTELGAILYDPFVGAGTAVIACEKLGRRCNGVEIEPRYVDVTIRRWEEYTGGNAELVTDA